MKEIDSFKILTLYCIILTREVNVMYVEVVKASVPNTHARILGDIRKKSFGKSDYHLHNEIEIMYVKEGCVKWKLPDTSILLKSGEVLFVNARIPHATDSTETGVSNLVIQFDIEKLLQNHSVQKNKYLRRLINGGEVAYHRFMAGEKETEELIQYIEKIDEENNGRQKAYDIYIQSYIFSIIGFLYRHNYLLDSENILIDKDAIKKIDPFLTYIENHYHDDITLDSVSQYFGLNPSYLCRLFKKATNSTFTKYLNLVRIVNAEELLTTTNDSVLEIALSVGFPNVSYFNRIFKQYTNCTPGFYRKVKVCK